MRRDTRQEQAGRGARKRDYGKEKPFSSSRSRGQYIAVRFISVRGEVEEEAVPTNEERSPRPGSDARPKGPQMDQTEKAKAVQ